MEVTGTAVTYNREATMPAATFYDVGDSWTEATPTFTQVTTALRIMGGDADVDNFLQATYADPNDIEAEISDPMSDDLSGRYAVSLLVQTSRSAAVAIVEVPRRRPQRLLRPRQRRDLPPRPQSRHDSERPLISDQGHATTQHEQRPCGAHRPRHRDWLCTSLERRGRPPLPVGGSLVGAVRSHPQGHDVSPGRSQPPTPILPQILPARPTAARRRVLAHLEDGATPRIR